MNRPDLDALEREYVAPNNDEGEDVKELIAYARHLEAQITAYEDEVYSANLAHNEYEARISELETALEALVPGGGAVFTATDFENAARVLRKGE